LALLNEDIAYGHVATSQSRQVFLPEIIPTRELLHTGTRLCFFAPALGSPSSASQWWILLNPFQLSDRRTMPGIGEFLYHSGCRFDHNHQLIAAPGVKLGCAEPRSRFVLVALTKSVFGYIGLTNTHRPEPNGGTMPLPGGEFRVWIPGLSAEHIQRLPIPRELQYVAPEPTSEEAEEAPEAVSEAQPAIEESA
jgi:hypothetical protein